MSRFNRKYSWKHVALAVVLFAAVGSVNIIPRETVITSQCKGASSATESVKVTRRGWPLTYSESREATKVCLVFNRGNLTQTANIKPSHDLNVAALVVNEVILVAAAGTLLVVLVRARQVIAEAAQSKHGESDE